MVTLSVILFIIKSVSSLSEFQYLYDEASEFGYKIYKVENVTQDESCNCFEFDQGLNGVGSWGTWSECTPNPHNTCHRGLKIRTRCANTEKICRQREWSYCYHESSCSGQFDEWKNITGGVVLALQCGRFLECSANCGGGKKLKLRKCMDDKKGSFGAFCKGKPRSLEVVEVSCNEQSCPEWSAWKRVKECSVDEVMGDIVAEYIRECHVSGKPSLQCNGRSPNEKTFIQCDCNGKEMPTLMHDPGFLNISQIPEVELTVTAVPENIGSIPTWSLGIACGIVGILIILAISCQLANSSNSKLSTFRSRLSFTKNKTDATKPVASGNAMKGPSSAHEEEKEKRKTSISVPKLFTNIKISKDNDDDASYISFYGSLRNDYISQNTHKQPKFAIENDSDSSASNATEDTRCNIKPTGKNPAKTIVIHDRFGYTQVNKIKQKKLPTPVSKPMVHKDLRVSTKVRKKVDERIQCPAEYLAGAKGNINTPVLHVLSKKEKRKRNTDIHNRYSDKIRVPQVQASRGTHDYEDIKI